MNRYARVTFLVALAVSLSALFGPIALAQEKKSFKVGYSLYVGFIPFVWMQQSGVMKKWADKYGIDVELILVNDYVGSVNQLIAGELDAVGVAGMDALTMPAAGGVDTTVFLITDYSNGNDAIVSKTAKSVAELAEKEVFLLQYSVSHYLLNRALVLNDLPGVGALTTTNISDSEVSAAFLSQPSLEHVVSWKPMVSDMLAGASGSTVVFDSSKIPGEIMDVFVGKTETLQANPELGKALTGAWYETLAAMNADGPEGKQVRTVLASAMGTDLAGLKSQTDTTFFFNTPAEAAAFLSSPKTKEIWDYVRTFSFEQGLFGQGAASVDAIGIEFADKSVLGDAANIKLRVDASFAALGAEGKL
ncbi:putative urea ABC transporter substrate-binding protein [Aureimonas sp. SA4125]|uniref:putative urea ABC transporter substrate-binding protein n=1 Tax=Aureimonas sp. SA4125 TaxID=2826993 RepID=UPI001CC38EE5|nr:putative urea ABC transporter substrate-binding protein [Aureimonas sp. SA4125]